MNTDTIFQKMLSRGNVAGLPIFQVSLDSEDDIATFDPGQVPNGTLIFFSIPSTGRGVIMQWDSVAGALIEPGGVGSMDGVTIATALDEYLESDEWRGGDTAMTGEAIEAVLDAYYGSTAWRDATTGASIVAALNSELGNVWSARSYERSFLANLSFVPSTSSYTPLAYIDVAGTAGFSSVQWHHGGIVDGVTHVNMDEVDFSVSTETWMFPTSVTSIAVIHATDGTHFEKLVAALGNNPHWQKLPLFRTLDCSAVSSSTGYFTTEIQGHIDNLMAQSWVIYTPGSNLPQSPWVQVPSGIANAVDISGMGVLYVVRGDNGTTLEGEALYVCETDSQNPVDWLQVTSVSGWPARSSRESTPSSIAFSATFVNGNFYAYKP